MTPFLQWLMAFVDLSAILLACCQPMGRFQGRPDMNKLPSSAYTVESIAGYKSFPKASLQHEVCNVGVSLASQFVQNSSF